MNNNGIIMNHKFIFSIVIAIYNTELYVQETIESIINQTFDFSKVQLILIDDGSTDNSGEICKEYQEKYPDNIVYVYKDNGGQTTARNLGIDYIEGKYINFIDSDDKLDSNTLTEVYNFFERHYDEIDVVSIPIYRFGASEGSMYLNYKFDTTRVIDINEEFNCPQFSISATFIKADAFTEKFDKRLIISEDATLVNKIILKKGKYGVVNSARYLYRKRFEENSTIDTRKFEKQYFVPRVKYYMEELIEYSINMYGEVLKYVQFCLMHDLQWMYQEKDIINVLNNEEFNEFEFRLKNVLKYIDDDIILSQRFLNKFFEYHILKFKHDYDNTRIISNSNNVILKFNDKKIDDLKSNKINLIELKIDNNILYLNVFFDSCFEGVEIELFNNNLPIELEKYVGDEVYALGNKISNRIYFKAKINLLLDYNEIKSYAKFDNQHYEINFSASENNFVVKHREVKINQNKIKVKRMVEESEINPINSVLNDSILNNKNEVFTLWVSDEDYLPELVLLSLKSMLLVGHDVILYTYKNLKNVPKGVIVKDGHEVLDKSMIFRYKKGYKSYSGFANYFRLKRLYELGGTWIDLDILLIKNINDVIKEDIAICSEPHHQEYLHCNNAILRFPKGDLFIKNMYDYAKKRGKDVNHGETGPHLITKKIFKGDFSSYGKFVKTPNFNNIMGWWEINKYFEDPTITLNNVDLEEVVGFHMVNTFFSSPEFEIQDTGIYGLLKESILNSETHEEYLNNLNINGLIVNDVFDYVDTINLKRFHSDAVDFTFLININKIKKIDLYLILRSIELSSNSHEILIFGITDVIDERFLNKENCSFVTSFEMRNVEKYIHGKYVIPLNEPVIFKNNWSKTVFSKENYDVLNVFFASDFGSKNINVFTIDTFNNLIKNNQNIFNLHIDEIKTKFNVKDLINDEIFGLDYSYTMDELKLINIIDSLLFNDDISDSEYCEIKKEVSSIFQIEKQYNLSYYYWFSCRNILESETLNEFLLNYENNVLKSQLNWNNKSNDYFSDVSLKRIKKLEKTNIENKRVISDLNDWINDLKGVSGEKERVISDLNDQISNLKTASEKSNALINSYKNELLSANLKNEANNYEIYALKNKLKEYEKLFDEILNSKYYSLLHPLIKNTGFDKFKK